MDTRAIAGTKWLALTAGLWLAGLVLAAEDPEILRIGIMESIGQGTSPQVRQAIAPEFTNLVKEFTGLRCVTLEGIEPYTAARQLETGKWHLGIFQGVEFAWVHARHKDLQPFMVVVYDSADIRAALVVKQDNDFKKSEELKGKRLCILQTKLHCRLYADKLGRGRAQDFFGKIFQGQSGEDTLDDLLSGKYDAAVVDTTMLKLYKDVAPGRFKRLKVLGQSESFPSAAIAFRKGVLSDGLLQKVRAGMLKANQSESGRAAMDTFQIKSFAPVPADYEKRLSAILKAYPPPAE